MVGSYSKRIGTELADERKRKFLVTNPEFHKKLKTDSLFMKFFTILEYMSKVNYKAPIFYFPASPEANQFYSLVDLPDINWNTTKLTFLMLPFDVCTDKGYAYLRTGRGRVSPELVKLKGCIDNSTHQTYYWMWYACEYDATPMLECERASGGPNYGGPASGGPTYGLLYDTAREAESATHLFWGLPNHKSGFYK